MLFIAFLKNKRNNQAGAACRVTRLALRRKLFSKGTLKELFLKVFKAFEAIFLLETEKPVLQSLIFGCGFIALTAFSGLAPQHDRHRSFVRYTMA